MVQKINYEKQFVKSTIMQAVVFLFLLIPLPVISGTIQGYVYKEVDNQPIDNVFLTLYSGDCDNRTYIDQTVTSFAGQQSGQYRFENVPAGSYRLLVEPMESLFSSQYAPEWGKSTYDAYSCEQAEMITLADSDSTENLNFFVGDGATISGTVFFSDGTSPVTWDNSYVEIYAIDVNDCTSETNFHRYRIQMHETIAAGTYSLTLGPGQYYLVARPYTYDNASPIELKTEWWSTPKTTPICSQGIPVTIATNSDDHTGIDFQLDYKSDKPFAWNLFLPALIRNK